MVGLLTKDPCWQRYENGIYNETLCIKFAPAMGEAHSRHGLVENKVKSVKVVLGDSDLSSFDPISLHLHLDLLFHELNCIPLITKSISNRDLDCLQLQTISPNSLYGRESASFSLTTDPEELNSQGKAHRDMLFDQAWRIWALCARQQTEADVRASDIPLGSIVVFRRDERGPGCLKNRFSTGLVL